MISIMQRKLSCLTAFCNAMDQQWQVTYISVIFITNHLQAYYNGLVTIWAIDIW